MLRLLYDYMSNAKITTFTTILLQFIHVTSCEWWSCGSTWTLHFYFTIHNLLRE